MCRFKDLNDPFKEFFQFKLSNCSLLIDHRIRVSNYQLRGNRHLNSGFYLTIICKYLETALSINLKQLFFLLFFYLSLIHQNTFSLRLLTSLEIHHFIISLLNKLDGYVDMIKLYIKVSRILQEIILEKFLLDF